MMKAVQKTCILVALFLLLVPCLTAYGMAPPHGYGTENGNDDLMANLEKHIDDLWGEYIENNPDGGDASSGQGYHLEYRQVILPVADASLNLGWCEYRERNYGSGVNYTYHTYYYGEADTNNPADITVTIYYSYDDPNKAYKNHNKSSYIVSMTVTDGEYNGMPYSAATKINKDGVEFTQYNLVRGNLFIVISDLGPFNESRLASFSFEETELVLPVFVNEQNYIQGQGSKTFLWVLCGVAVLLIGYFAWTKRRRRA